MPRFAIHHRRRPPYMKTGMAYHLIISTSPHDSAYGPNDKTGSAEWKIDDPRGPSWTTVDGAISYITGMRDKSKDAVVRKNAGETLAKLATLH